MKKQKKIKKRVKIMNSRGVITRGMVLLAGIILFAVIGTVIAIMVGKNKSDDKYK